MNWYRFEPKPRVGERRAKAVRELQRLQKNSSRALRPVIIEGRRIARTFWGESWCSNLEAYRDFQYRLPRGRSYVRHRAVLDLHVQPGRVDAVVSGSSLYDIEVLIKPLEAGRWAEVQRQCAGAIGSMIELLEGRLSEHVMKIITDLDAGLFPRPGEIEMHCSCPDWARMCKHVAAVMYGIGARLDDEPELLFTLRQLDHNELISAAADMEALPSGGAAAATLDEADLSEVFGIELDGAAAAIPSNGAASPTGKASRERSPATPGRNGRQEPAAPRKRSRGRKATGKTTTAEKKAAVKKTAAKKTPAKKAAVKKTARRDDSAKGRGSKKKAGKETGKKTGKKAGKKTAGRKSASRKTAAKPGVKKNLSKTRGSGKAAVKKAGAAQGRSS